MMLHNNNICINNNYEKIVAPEKTIPSFKFSAFIIVSSRNVLNI